MSHYDLIRRAKEEVFALCRGRQNGGRIWTMCIPVREDDSDRVIIAGLNAVERSVSGFDALLAVAKAIRPMWVYHIDEDELSAAVKALDAAHPGWRDW